MSNKKENIEKDTLEKVIFDLCMSFDISAKARNSDLIKQLNAYFNENEQLYESEIQLAHLYFEQFAGEPWFEKYGHIKGRNASIINLIYTNVFPHFIRQVIEQNEGSACSGDKEAFVLNKVKQAILTNTNLSLYETYNDNKEKQAYWSPKSFKDTDEVIERFWKWYDVVDEK